MRDHVEMSIVVKLAEDDPKMPVVRTAMFDFARTVLGETIGVQYHVTVLYPEFTEEEQT